MTHPLWTLAEVVAASAGTLDVPAEAAARGQTHGSDPSSAASITGISIDTRTLAPGDLFVPLSDARDGHDFVTAAFERDAVAALVKASYARQPGDGTLIRVDDPLRALERIGIAARARLAPTARVIAVTGSAGKTGTKEMLRACLKTCASSPDKVHAPEKSFNNHWGVPLTLARMPADTEFAVFEIGMNHAGEIRPLTKMVRPHIAIVTNVLPVHVGNFEDGEIGIANAKAEIFEGLEGPTLTALDGDLCSPPPCGEGSGVGVAGNPPTSGSTPPPTPPRQGEGGAHDREAEREARQTGGTAIILRDSPHYQALHQASKVRGATVLTFGAHMESDVSRGNTSGVHGDPERQFVTARMKSTEAQIEFELGMLGLHLATNSLAVVAALAALDCDLPQVLPALARVQSAHGRGARMVLTVEGGELLLVDESYNANPASMAAALGNLEATDLGGRRIAVLGDMLELGPKSVDYHVGLLPDAARADLVFCCGANMRHLYDALPSDKQGSWAATSIDLIGPVLNEIGAGDAVMVKGSLGTRMAPIVDAIKKRFAGA